MASLMELVERVNKGEMIEPDALDAYQDSPNSAEKFLAHHAAAILDLRRAHQHMLQSLEAIDFGDQKVLSQFMSVSAFLGLSDLRAAPVVRFGGSAISRREYALGLEAIQNGVSFDLQNHGSFTSDRDNCLFIASLYERAAAALRPTDMVPCDWSHKQIRIGIIVSSICDEESSGRFLRSLARHMDAKHFKLYVYCTEAGVRRDKQQFAQNSYSASSSRRGAQTVELLSERKISCCIASNEGDVTSATRELAGQMIKDKIDVAIFDATQADPIAAVLTEWEIARSKVNLCRRMPLYSASLDSVIYLDESCREADRDFWARRKIECSCVPEGMDVEDPLGPPPQRSAYGIPDAAIVLATAGTELDKTISTEFIDTMIDILRAHPHAVYLLIGDGELAEQKRKFEASGVGKRVGYAGRRRDLPGFLRMADIYIAEFPAAGPTGLLQAMTVERPVLVTRSATTGKPSPAIKFAGEDCTVLGAAALIERVSKLIREPEFRQLCGIACRQRIANHFGFAQTVRQIEQICEALCEKRKPNMRAAA